MSKIIGKINCVSKVNILFISLADTVQITASADAGYHVEYLAGQPYWVMYESRRD